jgi:zinc-ribbon domain
MNFLIPGKGGIMAANIQCPNCKQIISPEAQSCPHCGVQLHTQIHKTGGLTPGELKRPLPDIVKQFDASATTNITISGVLIAFYSGAIFAGKVLSTGLINAFLYALPLGLLLVAIVLALRVFYPDGYLTDNYPTLINKKEKRLQASSLFLEVAIGILVISVFVYLIRPA